MSDFRPLPDLILASVQVDNTPCGINEVDVIVDVQNIGCADAIGVPIEITDGTNPQTFMVAGRFRSAEEVPERAERLLAGGRAAGLTFEQPVPRGLAQISAIHHPAYLRFLETIHARWSEVDGAGPEVIPNLHLDRTLGGYPSSPTGQASAACTLCRLTLRTPIGLHQNDNSSAEYV